MLGWGSCSELRLDVRALSLRRRHAAAGRSRSCASAARRSPVLAARPGMPAPVFTGPMPMDSPRCGIWPESRTGARMVTSSSVHAAAEDRPNIEHFEPQS